MTRTIHISRIDLAISLNQGTTTGDFDNRFHFGAY